MTLIGEPARSAHELRAVDARVRRELVERDALEQPVVKLVGDLVEPRAAARPARARSWPAARARRRAAWSEPRRQWRRARRACGRATEVDVRVAQRLAVLDHDHPAAVAAEAIHMLGVRGVSATAPWLSAVSPLRCSLAAQDDRRAGALVQVRRRNQVAARNVASVTRRPPTSAVRRDVLLRSTRTTCANRAKRTRHAPYGPWMCATTPLVLLALTGCGGQRSARGDLPSPPPAPRRCRLCSSSRST